MDVWLLVDVSASLDWGTALSSNATWRPSCPRRRASARRARQPARRDPLRAPAARRLPTAGRPGPPRRVLSLRLASPAPAGAGDRPDRRARLRDRLARRRSVIVVVSDFLAPDGWATPLRQLARRRSRRGSPADPREGDAGCRPGDARGPRDRRSAHGRHGRCAAARALRARGGGAGRQIDTSLVGCGAAVLVIGTDEPLIPDWSSSSTRVAPRGGMAARCGGMTFGWPTALLALALVPRSWGSISGRNGAAARTRCASPIWSCCARWSGTGRASAAHSARALPGWSGGGSVRRRST